MALVFDIKRYSINDGPGIRITIFMKGCPLSCIWCHNPEGISLHKQKMFTAKRCLGCRICVRKCPVQAVELTADGIRTDLSVCTLCGKCADICPANATEISGQTYSVEELMREIEKESIFMDQSGGGVTFCGGEPLMHPAFLKELLQRCQEKDIHCAVDTTLYARPEIVKSIMEMTDLFLVDLKHMDPEKHRRFCGVPNDRILSNLQMVAEAGKNIVIRIPLIEGINSDEENIIRSATFISGLPVEQKMVHLLPYHDIAKGKHEKLGTLYNRENIHMAAPDISVQHRCLQIMESYGIRASIGG